MRKWNISREVVRSECKVFILLHSGGYLLRIDATDSLTMYGHPGLSQEEFVLVADYLYQPGQTHAITLDVARQTFQYLRGEE